MLHQEKIYLEPGQRVAECKKLPTRLWSLMKEPELPIDPVHGRNAFLEDKGHDWKWFNGKLNYNSRLGNDNGRWILLEYEC